MPWGSSGSGASGGADGLGYHWHSFGAALIGLGRLTALLAGYLALVEVLLLARLPFLERLVGFDRLTVWHRRNGYAVIGLVLAHVVFSVWGYARQDGNSFLGEYWNWLTLPQPGAATFGGAPARRPLPTRGSSPPRSAPRSCSPSSSPRSSSSAESSRTSGGTPMHFTVYAAIALSWFHMIPDGNEFVIDRDRGRLLAQPVRADARARALLPGRAAARASRPLRSARHRGHARGAGRRLAPDRRARPRAARRRGGPVLLLAVPHERLLVDEASVLALGGAGRGLLPDHGEGPRRPHRQARRDPGRHPRLRGGAVRGVHRGREPDVEGAADRGRDRHHTRAGAPRADGRRRRRALPRRLERRDRVRATSSTGSLPRAERASST